MRKSESKAEKNSRRKFIKTAAAGAIARANDPAAIAENIHPGA